jgi:two-component system LytT family response regulator
VTGGIGLANTRVRLHAGQTSHLAHVAMNTLEKSLDPATFLRIHRSIIVNVGRIRELEPAAHGEYVVTLANGVRVRSGRTYHERLKALASNPF